MDNPAIFVVAVLLCLASFILFFFVVLKPRYGSIPADRRRPEAHPDQTTMSRVSQSVVDGMGGVLGKSGGPYNQELLYNAGVKMAPADFTIMVLVSSLMAGLLGFLLMNPVIGVLLAVAVPFGARLLLSIRTDKRRGRFESQLIDTIQMLIGGLRAGHGVMRSIEAAGLESEAPTSEELRRIVNETRIGKDAHQALEETADRVDSEDFRWIAQAIQINREVGGDLAEVLEQVAGTIRERTEIKGQVRSLSAEGKLSAVILMAMPVAVAVMLTFVNPGYMNVFVEKPIGIILMIVSVVMFVLGGFWMSRTVKIKF